MKSKKDSFMKMGISYFSKHFQLIVGIIPQKSPSKTGEAFNISCFQLQSSDFFISLLRSQRLLLHRRL